MLPGLLITAFVIMSMFAAANAESGAAVNPISVIQDTNHTDVLSDAPAAKAGAKRTRVYITVMDDEMEGDNTVTWLVPPSLTFYHVDPAGFAYDGNARVLKEDTGKPHNEGKWIYINERGERVNYTEQQAISARAAREAARREAKKLWISYSAAESAKYKDKVGIIDRNGTVVLPFEYDAITEIENNLVLVNKDGKWGIAGVGPFRPSDVGVYRPSDADAETSQPSAETSQPPDETPLPAAAEIDNNRLNVTAKLADGNARGSFDLPDNQVNKSLAFSWNAILNAADYKVTVSMRRFSTRTDSVAKNAPIEVFTGNDTFYTITEVRPLKKYSLTVTAYDGNGNAISEETVDFVTYRVPRAIFPEDAFNGDKKEIRAAQKTVKVPVWKLDKNGKKYGSALNITIHQALADEVLAIFTEIYNGPEQFPIYEAGGFQDRSGDHGLGLAIDINSNENMYISGGGRTVGKLWEPYKNPYSITPYGDVVTAFERHGFFWGGDAFSNVDYMHFFFSYDTFPTYYESLREFEKLPAHIQMLLMDTGSDK